MQPLYTVDHESRHNSTNHTEEVRPVASEISPLIQQLPQFRPRNSSTLIIVTFLLIILITGVIIGIYLLVIQSDSENVLPPPVERPLQLVLRSQWDHGNGSLAQHISLSPFKTNEVMVVQTNTDTCQTTESCIQLLQAMQVKASATKRIMPYNFLISSNGQTYEGLGWHRHPAATGQPYKGLVLALIGNFSEVQPTPLQIQEAKKFFAMSVSQQYLDQFYRIVGNNVRDTPVHLSNILMKFPQWSNEFIDANINNKKR
ncbi:unnamed protein product [Arctia plantaginis]|uniref:Peptidoglycan recognition protein family domain-containing protein n=1 Tax=Arctia plantaginis TaxID=874455 RepID=A0A8S0Z1E9_ARCPL|nr:unnamed protein product [Arctia plantaginis]